jgi:putative flippase GtrA
VTSIRVPSALSRLLSRDRASGQAVRFLVVGLTNTVVDLGAFYLLTLIPGMPDIAAKTVSYVLGICNSFVWNKLWTFNARRSGRTAQEFGLFFLVNLPPLIVNIVVFSLLGLWTTSGSFAAREGKAFIAAVIAVIWNFLGSRYLAFRHTALKQDDLSETDGSGRGVEQDAVDKHVAETNGHA